MEMINNDQLMMLQIGILISKYIPEGEKLETLADAAKIIQDNLGVEIKRGDNLNVVYEEVLKAVTFDKEMSELGDWFYTEWIKEDMADMIEKQICEAMDCDIIDEIIDEDKQARFKSAMKGL